MKQNKVIKKFNRFFERFSWEIHNWKVLRAHGSSDPVGGFYLDPLDYDFIVQNFDSAKSIKIDLRNSPYYLNTNLSSEVLLTLNTNNNYKDGFALIPVIEFFDSKYGDRIKQIVKSPYRIVNVRAWEMLPLTSSFGPSNFHTDGFEKSHLKIMLYLSELNSETGTIQFKDESPLEKTKGYVLVFQNSDLVHSAVPGTKNKRKLIEITIQKTTRDLGLKPVTGYCNDRHLKKPKFVLKRLL
jgi:hypothetical protein